MIPWGVYIHIPYCRSLCPYCDFNVHINRSPPWQQLTNAIVREFAHRRAQYPASYIQSIYFGGGTPSLMPLACIAQLLDAIRQHGVVGDAEITLEANPGTIDAAYANGLQDMGINRLSLGWQSTKPALLRQLGRDHNTAAGYEAFALARKAGFDNISLDFIFAVPKQTFDDLEHDLQTIAQLKPDHVALYALTFHAQTSFGRRLARGRIKPVDEEIELAMMRMIEAKLIAQGFEHYEVSSYARGASRQSRHNHLYWQGAAYLGLGPGAHSFYHNNWQIGYRCENMRDPAAYIKHWQAVSHDKQLFEHEETLTPRQMLLERMITGLRKTEGVSLCDPLMQQFAADIMLCAQVAIKQDWLVLDTAAHQLRPTPLGLEHADSVAALFA